MRQSQENAARIEKVIREFGFGGLGLSAADFAEPEQIIQLGVAPHRIDIMTFLSGISFDEAWNTRVSGRLDGIDVPFLSRDMLIRNKKASGRVKDLADIEYLLQ